MFNRTRKLSGVHNAEITDVEIIECRSGDNAIKLYTNDKWRGRRTYYIFFNSDLMDRLLSKVYGRIYGVQFDERELIGANLTITLEKVGKYININEILDIVMPEKKVEQEEEYNDELLLDDDELDLDDEELELDDDNLVVKHQPDLVKEDEVYDDRDLIVEEWENV